MLAHTRPLSNTCVFLRCVQEATSPAPASAALQEMLHPHSAALMLTAPEALQALTDSSASPTAPAELLSSSVADVRTVAMYIEKQEAPAHAAGTLVCLASTVPDLL